LTTLPSRIETVIVGAGQAGLTMSWYLRQAEREHILLERRATLGGGWLDRWDQFRLVGPNWTASFPDAPYDGDDPDGFMPRDEIAATIGRYAQRILAPIVLGTAVERVSATSPGFAVRTSGGEIRADQVIVATGGFHVPHIPAIAGTFPATVRHLHAHDYRREADLPPGAVLLVGSGQTGVQLTEELREAGRDVYLSVGSAGRAPRRYRGRDIFEWLALISDHGDTYGTNLPSAEQLPDPRRRLAGNVQLSGHHGGHSVDLRELARHGTVLLGRLVGVDGDRVRLGDDLLANLDWADRAFGERIQPTIDAYIETAGLDSPPDEPTAPLALTPPVIEELELGRAGISTIIWTSGYRQDLGWIEPSITDELGFARQTGGVSELPGLSFIGSLWLRDQLSATLFGLPRDARALARQLGLTV
jgi:putative flavoprotein involved in K+ transport